MKRKAMAVVFTGLVVGLAADCASQPSAGERSPRVTIEQVGSVLAMGVAPSGGIPMQYRLTIENPFDHEVRLVSVEMETVGQSGGYSMTRVRHPFDETIAPHSSRELNFRAWVRVLTESEERSVDHPVLLRGVARFATASGTMSRKFSGRANATSRTTTTQ